jgi:hypothetical protein
MRNGSLGLYPAGLLSRIPHPAITSRGGSG